MPIAGPFLSGGISRNNQFAVSFNPSGDIPSGALVWLIAGTDVADTANVIVTDSVGNTYVNQVFVQPPGVPGTILVAVARNAVAIPAAGTVTITSDVRGDWDANLYHHTGAAGAINSIDLQFVDTSMTPVATCFALKGMTLFGTIGVHGPSADGFTPDPNWGPDQKGSIARTNVTIHASGRLADASARFSYAPVLGTARRSLIFAASFW